MKELRDKAESFCDGLRELPQDYTDLKDLLIAFAEEIIWHGPDEVPPRECMFARVYGDDGRLYRYSRQNECWMVYNEKGKCISDMWVKGMLNKWRYPAPIKE